MRHAIAAILVRHVLDHLAAAPHTEVDIDIRHADALRVEEALEHQAVHQRVDVGNPEGIRHQASGSAAASRTHGYALFAGKPDEIPDDQKIPREPHLADYR